MEEITKRNEKIARYKAHMAAIEKEKKEAEEYEKWLEEEIEKNKDKKGWKPPQNKPKDPKKAAYNHLLQS